MMNRVLLCIGSNIDSEVNIKHSKETLCSIFGDIIYSKTNSSAPYGDKYKNKFHNVLAYFETNMNYDDVNPILKRVERDMGRTPKHKQEGIVPIDIDLICWNENVVKPTDFERSYVVELLSEEPFASLSF